MRSLFTLVVGIMLMSAFPARADICTAGACGHWYAPAIDVLIGPQSMRWTDGTSDDCSIFAQDRYVTILACTEYVKGKRGETEMFYFLQALGDDLHVRKSPELPSCIGRRSCWPQPGADFQLLSGRP